MATKRIISWSRARVITPRVEQYKIYRGTGLTAALTQIATEQVNFERIPDYDFLHPNTFIDETADAATTYRYRVDGFTDDGRTLVGNIVISEGGAPPPPTFNLVAGAGCSGTANGFVTSNPAPYPYYPWCKTVRGTWSGDLDTMLPAAPGDLLLIAFQSNVTGSVFSVLIYSTAGSPAQSVFTSITFTDRNGTPRTFLSAAANTFQQYGGGSQSMWQWNTAPLLFDDAGNYEVLFNP